MTREEHVVKILAKSKLPKLDLLFILATLSDKELEETYYAIYNIS